MSSSPVGPQSEQDWTIHSLNIHGIFFERWCQQVINSQRDCWTVTTTNYPVQVAGHQSNLDIRADLRVGDRRLLLNIECKKNNPEFVDWVFFLKAEGIGSGVLLPHIEIDEGQGPLVRVAIQPLVLRAPTIQFVNDARETRGNYQSYKGQNKTRTSNAAITEAAMQIALATASVYAEEIQLARDCLARRSLQNPSVAILHPNTNIVPMIVTSANLFVCDFHPNDVDGATGQIPFSKAALSEVPMVVYEFPLPHHLHNRSDETEVAVRRHIIIVHSSRFYGFLRNGAFDLLPPER